MSTPSSQKEARIWVIAIIWWAYNCKLNELFCIIHQHIECNITSRNIAAANKLTKLLLAFRK
jgi:hypothetical protein